MSNTKHTPGPWKIHKAEDGTLHINQDNPLSRVATLAKGKGDAEDARLIAAAPELLEALRRILARPDVNMQFGDDEVFARAAIAKATGSNA